MAQAVHAATAFALRHPERAASTLNVVILAVPDEDALLHHADLDHFAHEYGVVFTEPDLDDEATAYANVSDGSRYSSLPLAGRVSIMT